MFDPKSYIPGTLTNNDIKVVCAWCQRHMEGPENATITSHGMCPECMKKEMEALETVRVNANHP